MVRLSAINKPKASVIDSTFQDIIFTNCKQQHAVLQPIDSTNGHVLFVKNLDDSTICGLAAFSLAKGAGNLKLSRKSDKLSTTLKKFLRESNLALHTIPKAIEEQPIKGQILIYTKTTAEPLADYDDASNTIEAKESRGDDKVDSPLLPRTLRNRTRAVPPTQAEDPLADVEAGQQEDAVSSERQKTVADKPGDDTSTGTSRPRRHAKPAPSSDDKKLDLMAVDGKNQNGGDDEARDETPAVRGRSRQVRASTSVSNAVPQVSAPVRRSSSRTQQSIPPQSPATLANLSPSNPSSSAISVSLPNPSSPSTVPPQLSDSTPAQVPSRLSATPTSTVPATGPPPSPAAVVADTTTSDQGQSPEATAASAAPTPRLFPFVGLPSDGTPMPDFSNRVRRRRVSKPKNTAEKTKKTKTSITKQKRGTTKKRIPRIKRHARQNFRDFDEDAAIGEVDEISDISEEEDGDDSDDACEDGEGCKYCGSNEDTATMLLCDGKGCNVSYHMQCLRPMLDTVPVGDWYCPKCNLFNAPRPGRGVVADVADPTVRSMRSKPPIAPLVATRARARAEKEFSTGFVEPQDVHKALAPVSFMNSRGVRATADPYHPKDEMNFERVETWHGEEMDVEEFAAPNKVESLKCVYEDRNGIICRIESFRELLKRNGWAWNSDVGVIATRKVNAKLFTSSGELPLEAFTYVRKQFGALFEVNLGRAQKMIITASKGTVPEPIILQPMLDFVEKQLQVVDDHKASLETKLPDLTQIIQNEKQALLDLQAQRKEGDFQAACAIAACAKSQTEHDECDDWGVSIPSTLSLDRPVVIEEVVSAARRAITSAIFPKSMQLASEDNLMTKIKDLEAQYETLLSNVSAVQAYSQYRARMRKNLNGKRVDEMLEPQEAEDAVMATADQGDDADGDQADEAVSYEREALLTNQMGKEIAMYFKSIQQQSMTEASALTPSAIGKRSASEISPSGSGSSGSGAAAIGGSVEGASSRSTSAAGGSAGGGGAHANAIQSSSSTPSISSGALFERPASRQKTTDFVDDAIDAIMSLDTDRFSTTAAGAGAGASASAAVVRTSSSAMGKRGSVNKPPSSPNMSFSPHMLPSPSQVASLSSTMPQEATLPSQTVTSFAGSTTASTQVACPFFAPEQHAGQRVQGGKLNDSTPSWWHSNGVSWSLCDPMPGLCVVCAQTSLNLSASGTVTGSAPTPRPSKPMVVSSATSIATALKMGLSPASTTMMEREGEVDGDGAGDPSPASDDGDLFSFRESQE